MTNILIYINAVFFAMRLLDESIYYFFNRLISQSAPYHMYTNIGSKNNNAKGFSGCDQSDQLEPGLDRTQRNQSYRHQSY